MSTVSKGVLKAKMLAYFRRVEEKGEVLVVTAMESSLPPLTRDQRILDFYTSTVRA